MMARQAAARGRWLVKSPAAACALARGGPVSCSLRLRRARCRLSVSPVAVTRSTLAWPPS